MVLSALTGNQVVNFTARLNPGGPILVSYPDSTRGLVLDSILRTGEPFRLTYSHSWGAVHRTKTSVVCDQIRFTADGGYFSGYSER